MRYLPLIWSAVMRKPTRTILTLLSVTVAFTLFGLMIGLNATFDEVAAKARADRIFTNARFGGNGMPIAVARQIAAIPGVKVRASSDFDCPQSDIRVTKEWGGRFEAIGCGRKAIYNTACEGLKCTVAPEGEAVPWRARPDPAATTP